MFHLACKALKYYYCHEYLNNLKNYTYHHWTTLKKMIRIMEYHAAGPGG